MPWFCGYKLISLVLNVIYYISYSVITLVSCDECINYISKYLHVLALYDTFHGRPLFPVKLAAGNFGTYIYTPVNGPIFPHGQLFPVISVRADQNSLEISVLPDPNFQDQNSGDSLERTLGGTAELEHLPSPGSS